MNYRNMAQNLSGMGNPYLPPDTRYGGHGFQGANVPRSQGWMSAGITNVPQGTQSYPGNVYSYSKTDPSVYEIIQQILQGMNRPPRLNSDVPLGPPNNANV